MNRDRAISLVPRQKVGKSSVESADIVIIGNGIAGLTAAVEARRFAPEKRIAIISEQNHPTINTPALKQFAIGKLEREQLLAYPPGTERKQGIHIINERVEKIEAQGKYVTMRGGSGFGYGSLLIATGSTPMGLSEHTPGRDFDGVLTLHRLQDYLDLRRRLGEVEEAVVIGGGIHAVETVMGLLHWGIEVNWLIRGDSLIPKMLDQTASLTVLERVQKAGARVYTQTEVLGIVGRVGVVAGVYTNHNEMIPCQLVLVCTGTAPVTNLAEQSSLPIKQKRGILVDDLLHTNIPDIYAAGDVAALKNPQTGEFETRAQWYAAVLQGRAAAAAMTEHAQSAPKFGAPWHATHLADLSMLTVGNPLYAEGIPYTDASKGNYRLLCAVDDRLVGYLSLGSTKADGLAIKRLIDEGHPIRDIRKELLSGEFDAQRYFSRQRTFAVQDMVTTGRLPVPQQILAMRENPIAPPPATPWIQPRTGPLEPEQPTRDTDAMVVYEDEDEFSPFTGNLPAIREKIVESSLTPTPPSAPPSTSRRGRNLWSYSDKVPVVKPGTTGKRASRSLWSYDTNNNDPKKNR